MKSLKYFERIVIWCLVVMLAIVIFFSLLQVAFGLVASLFIHPESLLDVDNLFGMLSSIFMVLIAMELFETVKMYIQKKGIYVELIIDVAIIAMARKLIIFDYSSRNIPILYGVAAAMVALGTVRYICKKTSNHCVDCTERKKQEEGLSK
ncbi:MAG: phosphate-starvation-inducible PsiE family protein [Fusobacteria bacterium]|nr:phosphate-starvation-inducible PsiE family protein [Fusobacteriota bacterium]